MNEIISHPFDFSDEEIVQIYMSLLKGLAVNLAAESIPYFIVQDRCPLYHQAILFYNFPESLIKTAARTVALSVMRRNLYSVKDPAVSRIVLQSTFLKHIVCYMRDQLYMIDQELLGVK